MERCAKTCLVVCTLFASVSSVAARTSIQIGYGLQLNSLLNSTVNANLQKAIFNDGAKSLTGISGTQPYSTNWSLSNGSDATPSALVQLPELRITSDWTLWNGMLGIFGAVSGIVPQTTAYYLGSVQLKESNTCNGVDYTNCALAAVGFVSSNGTAMYDAEIRSSIRFYNFTAGFNFGKKIGNVLQGDLTLAGELGLNVQSFAVNTQFAATRCTNGDSAPCAQNSQSRVLQGELTTQSVYALGPVVGLNLRYQRPQAFWFIEAALTTTFLFMKFENSGYTSFVAAGTVAFSQSSVGSGIDAAQNSVVVLPAILLRIGIHL